MKSLAITAALVATAFGLAVMAVAVAAPVVVVSLARSADNNDRILR